MCTTKCQKCGKPLAFRAKFYTKNTKPLTVCAACYQKIMESRVASLEERNGSLYNELDTAYAKLSSLEKGVSFLNERNNALIAENEELAKRLKNKGSRVWILDQSVEGRPKIFSGVIRNRTKDEAGVTFTNQELLDKFDIEGDSVTLFFPWSRIYTSEEEVNAAYKRLGDKIGEV